jgi:predicted membrane-bound mannosyltransferase
MVAAAAGAWVSSGTSGPGRLVIWAVVSAALAAAAAWFAVPAVALLTRLAGYGWSRRRQLSRLPVVLPAAPLAPYHNGQHGSGKRNRYGPGWDGDLRRDRVVQRHEVDGRR